MPFKGAELVNSNIEVAMGGYEPTAGVCIKSELDAEIDSLITMLGMLLKL